MYIVQCKQYGYDLYDLFYNAAYNISFLCTQKLCVQKLLFIFMFKCVSIYRIKHECALCIQI